MIINNLNIKKLLIADGKTDAVLIVDPDTVLPGPIAGQLFQMIGGRNTKILKACRVIYHHQFS